MINWDQVIQFSKEGSPKPPRRDERSEAQWRELLSDEVFRITRKAGTEAPFSSDQCHAFNAGQYQCACCQAPLFEMTSKFDSRSGWPSFTAPIEDNAIAYQLDDAHGMQRVEVQCSVCDGHLGHVFPDGPAPSGLRFCINALSMTY